MVSMNEDRGLNPRQQQFVSLYTSGIPAGRAYEQAGYASRGNTAEVGASKLVRNAKVAQAIERERNASRDATTLDRDEKLGILAEIARNAGAPSRERISAIKVHNVMTGDDVPQPPKKTGPSQLDLIRERAKHVISPLIHPAALSERDKRLLELQQKGGSPSCSSSIECGSH